MAGEGQEFFSAGTAAALQNLETILEAASHTLPPDDFKSASTNSQHPAATAASTTDVESTSSSSNRSSNRSSNGGGGNLTQTSSDQSTASTSTNTSTATASISTPYIDLADKHGARALHHAAIEGHTALAALLLQHRADPTVKDDHGRTPLDYANSLKRMETVRVIEVALAALAV
jgi:ankyrin repeat protein